MFAKVSLVVYYAFVAFFVLVGSIGVIVQGVLCSTEGPGFVKNQYLGLWLAALVLGFALLALWNTVPVFARAACMDSVFWKILLFLFYAIAMMECIMLFIGYAMAKRAELIFYTIMLNMIVFASGLFALRDIFAKVIHRNKEEYKGITETSTSEEVPQGANYDKSVTCLYVILVLAVGFFKWALLTSLTVCCMLY